MVGDEKWREVGVRVEGFGLEIGVPGGPGGSEGPGGPV